MQLLDGVKRITEGRDIHAALRLPLARELVQTFTGRRLPKLVMRAVLSAIGDRLWDYAGFRVEEVSPIDFAPACTAPAFFCVAEDDTFVGPAGGGAGAEHVGGGHRQRARRGLFPFFVAAPRVPGMDRGAARHDGTTR